MIQNTWHHSWDEFMNEETLSILSDIEKSLDADTYYPVKENILRFLNTDLNNISCCIVGMEPYPSNSVSKQCPQATGRSFEVAELQGESWNHPIQQNSLLNILKAIYFNHTGEVVSIAELRDKIESGAFRIANPDDWFDSMESQGVLFLNASLTVRPNEEDSHKKLWEPFRAGLIPFIESHSNPTWMLWGGIAQKTFKKYLSTDNILEAPHPRNHSFIKNNTFKYVPNINWTGIE